MFPLRFPFFASILAICLSAVPATADEEAKPTRSRVPIGMWREGTLPSGGKIVKVLNRKGQTLSTFKYIFENDNLADVRTEPGDQDAVAEPAVEVRPGYDPKRIRFMGTRVGSARFTIVGEDGTRTAFHIDTYRSEFLLVGHCLRLQMDPSQPFKEVISANPKVMSIHVSPIDPSTAVINALAAGKTPFSLVGKDGTREVHEVSVASEEPAKGKVVLAVGVSRRLQMSGAPDLTSVNNDNEQVVTVSPTASAQSVHIRGLSPGVCHLTLTSDKGKHEQFDVVATPPRRSLVLGKEDRVQILHGLKLKTVEAANKDRMEVSIDAKDPRFIVVKGLQSGDARVMVEAEDGGRDTWDCRLYSDKPGKGRLIVAQYETRRLAMSRGQRISDAENDAENVAETRPSDNDTSIKILGLQTGLAVVSFTSEKGDVEKHEVVVVEAKGKESRSKPIHVELGEKFPWKEITFRNYAQFLIGDHDVVYLERYEAPGPLPRDVGYRSAWRFLATQAGRTQIVFLKNDDGDRDVVEVIVSEKKK